MATMWSELRKALDKSDPVLLRKSLPILLMDDEVWLDVMMAAPQCGDSATIMCEVLMTWAKYRDRLVETWTAIMMAAAHLPNYAYIQVQVGECFAMEPECTPAARPGQPYSKEDILQACRKVYNARDAKHADKTIWKHAWPKPA